MRSLVRGLLYSVIGVGLAVGAAWAQSKDVAGDLKKLDAQIKAAQQLVKNREADKAAAAIADAEKLLEATKEGAAANPATEKTWQGAERSVVGLKRNLERIGGTAMAAGDKPATTPAGTPPKPNTPTTPPANATAGVSFMKDVAPMLSAKCGNCHMAESRGKFSMATFAALERGADGAAVITAGKGSESRLVEVIASGDMPRGGQKVTPAELASLTKWIDEGAKFDGPDKNAMLRGTRRPPADRPTLTVAKPTGKETVSFARDVAPVLAANCTGCHGNQNPSQGFSVINFERLLRGGDSGLAVMPNKGGDSLLIKKLKGTASDGARMPLRKAPLDDSTIAKIETWINEGASFDGAAPDMAVDMVAAIYEAEHMTSEQLAEKRVNLSQSNWKLGNPQEPGNTVKTDHFNIVGNIPTGRLEEIGQTAEAQYAKVRDLFKIPDAEELFKGKLTLFIFNKRFEYREFGTMVERRSLPEEWRAHWRYNIIDAYAAIAPPTDGNDTLERLLCEQLVGAYIDTLGTVPDWFSQGAARAVSAKMEPKNPAIKTWEERIPDILSSMTKPDALVAGELNAGDTAILGYAFCKALLGKTAQYQQLLRQLKAGDDFATAFNKAYRGDPAAAVSAFVAGGAGATGGRKR